MNTNKLICIDAGHGGSDSGAVFKGRLEKNDNLRLAFLLKEKLIANGFGILMTRESDVYKSLKFRTDLANAKKADLFIALHRNAFTTSAANGVENWVYTTADNNTNQMAQYILKEIAIVGSPKNRGVKKGNYHVLRESNMPACLLELLFISNPQDNEMYDKNFQQYADAIVKGICKFFGVSYVETAQKPEPPTAPEKLFKVQLGAFKKKSNALSLQEQLRQDGYDAVIIGEQPQ